MKDKLSITVIIGEQEVTRNYSIEDGLAPEDMQEKVQSMIDSIVDGTDYIAGLDDGNGPLELNEE